MFAKIEIDTVLFLKTEPFKILITPHFFVTSHSFQDISEFCKILLCYKYTFIQF